MIGRIGNIWDSEADAIVVPTNGEVKKNGYAVMGAGLALEANWRYPTLAYLLGQRLKQNGNHVYFFKIHATQSIITFPTKYHWKEKSSINLIRISLNELKDLVQQSPKWKRIALPLVGCGYGGLDSAEVVTVLEQYLKEDKYELWIR